MSEAFFLEQNHQLHTVLLISSQINSLGLYRELKIEECMTFLPETSWRNLWWTGNRRKNIKGRKEKEPVAFNENHLCSMKLDRRICFPHALANHLCKLHQVDLSHWKVALCQMSQHLQREQSMNSKPWMQGCNTQKSISIFQKPLTLNKVLKYDVEWNAEQP